MSATLSNPTIDAPGREPASALGRVRRFTETLCEPLTTEDYVIQSMPDASPAKWHLAHTTWFFERFVLADYLPGFAPHHEAYDYLFNSYYNTVGPMHCRPNRGLISRPTVEEVYDYRRAVDQRLGALLTGCDAQTLAALTPRVTLGVHHEQQHQELLLADLKHLFSSNPLLPAYQKSPTAESATRDGAAAAPVAWASFEAGLREIGVDGGEVPFCYDNETPRHKVYVDAFSLASRPATNGEYLRFIEDGGYRRPELWLSLGWATVQQEHWTHPIYWYQNQVNRWMHYTLGGPCEVEPDEPVCHLSYFEADAFARWCGARLPTEAEWETAAAGVPIEGNFADRGERHPRPTRQAPHPGGVHGLYGNVWEWTQSPYTAYPGYRPPPGALGEYNGKFMCNQFVLRGGSCATPRSHIRATYRNFFPPDARWQFAGVRLAQ